MLYTSVIIPVFNDEKDLRLVLQHLGEQTVSKEFFEVIVVDNGSEDQSIEIAKEFDFVQLLQETEYLNSPYSCRNRGIEQAKGDVIALLDASCKPVSEWLENALECMEQTGTEMVGGEVLFDFKEKMTAGKCLDSLTNINMKGSIEKKNVAKTANLFVKKTLFRKVGLFPEGLRSGGDLRWTGAATRMGNRLIFCKNATVYKTARDFSELIKKQWRVGLHQPLIAKEKGKNIAGFRKFLRVFKPVSYKVLKKKYSNSPQDLSGVSFFRVYLVAESVKIVMTAAYLWGAAKLKRTF